MASPIIGIKLDFLMVLDNWVIIWKKLKLDPRLTLYPRRSSKGVRDLNVKNTNIQVCEENMDKFLFNIIKDTGAVTVTQNPGSIKAKIKKSDYIKV